MLRTRDALCGLALLALLIPPEGRGQERIVISKEISVGRSEAALGLEFADGAKISLALRNGAVLVDGERVGAYAAGDALDVAWRALLGEAVALEDGPLSQKLRAWSPPGALEGEGLASARRFDEALDDALAPPTPSAPPTPPALSVGLEGDEALTRILLGQTSRLAALGEALKGLGSDIRLHIDEDVDVAAGETVEGNLVVIQGDARISGTVDGDVVVVDGTLDLLEGSVVRGDVRLVDAEVDREGGVVEGEVREVDGAAADMGDEIRDRVRKEMRDEIRAELEAQHGGGSAFFNPVRRVLSGIGGVLQGVVAIFILGLIGLGAVAFAPQNLDTVAEAARRAPGRAAMVGLAGAFLLIPVWVLGFVALLVTIVGIPVAIAWIPVFPLAAVAGALLGYVAVARNVGEWLADSGYPWTDWIRKSNSMTTITGGLVGLMAFFMAAHVLGIVPFFGFLKGLLVSVGVMATVVASLIGFGAVLLTRAGRRPEYTPRDPDDAWERVVDEEVDVDVGASTGGRDAEGTGGGGHA
ncbi:MAG TPA: hypothetical protein VLH75_15385 [Longimicrobiales bacterium]|nr:hypothetical protein [Longimicrobiales bacterium]